MPVWMQLLVGIGTFAILVLSLVRLPWIAEIRKDVREILEREKTSVERMATMEQWQKDHQHDDNVRFDGITKALDLIKGLIQRDRRHLPNHDDAPWD